MPHVQDAAALSTAGVELGSSKVLTLVSNITETMCNITLSGYVDEPPDGLTDFAAGVHVDGASPLTVAISSDRTGCAMLAAGLFQCDVADVDAEMIADAVSELVNMAAGQLKRALELDQALGIPKTIEPQNLKTAEGARSYVLAGENLKIVVWIADKLI